MSNIGGVGNNAIHALRLGTNRVRLYGRYGHGIRNSYVAPVYTSRHETPTISNSRQAFGADANVLAYCKSDCYWIGCARYGSMRIHLTSFKGGPSGGWPHCRGCPARRIDLCHASDISFLVYCDFSQNTSNGHSDSKGLSKEAGNAWQLQSRMERGRHDINVDSNSAFVQTSYSFVHSLLHSFTLVLRKPLLLSVIRFRKSYSK